MKFIVFKLHEFVNLILVLVQVKVSVVVVISHEISFYLLALLSHQGVQLQFFLEDQLFIGFLLFLLNALFRIFLLELFEVKLHPLPLINMCNIMQQSPIDKARAIYREYIEQVGFKEIEHVPDQFIDKEISLQEECLCISHGFFQKYYPPLIKMLASGNAKQDELNWICEVLLLMNGENDKAWNTKKFLLSHDLLSLPRQLSFTAAICYKNKKSSSYYDYRMKLFQKIVKTTPKEVLLETYLQETKLISKILGRFFRNYFCWMYRNRLFKLFFQYCGTELLQLQLSSLHQFIDNSPNDYSAYSRLISIVRLHSCNVDRQIKWIDQLHDFCTAAYEQKESYRHTETYKTALLQRKTDK